MLGLGSSLVSSIKGRTLVNTYTSDFTNDQAATTGSISSADAAVHSDYSIEGNLDKDTNQTVDGSAGWIKFTYDTNQTNSTGILTNLDGFVWQSGDIHIVTFDIYLGGTEWDCADIVSVRVLAPTTTQGIDFELPSASSGTSGAQVAQGETVSVKLTSYGNANTPTSQLYIYIPTGSDLPQADSWFALKNLVVKTYRLFG